MAGNGVNPVLDPIRFEPERVLIGELFERFGLDVVIDHFIDSGGATPIRDYVLGSQLRVTKVLSPRLWSLLEESKRALGFDEDVEIYVAQDASVNAASIHTLSPDKPHMLSLTSALVERMDDDELRFVLGHELGHLAYRHYRARLAAGAFGQDEGGESRVPPLLARRFESWDRLAEVSADRAGFTVVGRLEIAVSAFFKIQSGLGPEHLRFDIAAFLEQLEELKLERRELLSLFSHPATPIRVRALQLFEEVRGEGDERIRTVDGKVLELARLMDFEASKPLEVNARDFLLAAGMLTSHTGGGEMSDDEWQTLVQLLLPLCADPESEVARLSSAAQAEEMLARSIGWLRENAGEERYGLFRDLAHVAAVEGRLAGAKQAFMHRVADELGIPRKAADEILYDVLADYLQAQALRWSPLPHFASKTRPPPKV